MKKFSTILTIVLFCGMMVVFGVWCLLQPDRTFSEQENRMLAQVPTFSSEAFFSGQWGLDFEEYLSDQFPLRDQWIVLKAALQRGSGRQDNNGVYFGSRLMETFWSYDQEQLDRNLTAVENFAQSDPQGTTYFVPVPNAVAVSQDLPLLAPDQDQQALLADFSDAVPSAHIVDTFPGLLNASENGEDLYFATDHHINANGAYTVYCQLLEAMGLQPLNREEFSIETVSTSFTGTLYHKSGAWWTAPDTLERWEPVTGLDASITIYPDGETRNSLFFPEALETNDPYAYYVGGNQPLEVITTGQDGGSLLLIKDSYAHILAPLLACHFSEIHLVDLRYYRDSITQYRQEHQFDYTVILYNMKNLTEDTNLPLLGY